MCMIGLLVWVGWFAFGGYHYGAQGEGKTCFIFYYLGNGGRKGSGALAGVLISALFLCL